MIQIANNLFMVNVENVQIGIILINFGNVSKFHLFAKIMIKIMVNVHHVTLDILFKKEIVCVKVNKMCVQENKIIYVSNA